MAAQDIQRHFKGLRVQTGRRKGRDPFATGFEDDSDEKNNRRSRPQTKQAPAVEKPLTNNPAKSSAASKLPPAADFLRDSEHAFLDPPKSTDRRPSPAPVSLPQSRVTDGAGRRGSLDRGLQAKGLQGKSAKAHRASRTAREQAAGNLALLDDSDSEEEAASPPRRTDRFPSPAPRKKSDPVEPGQRSLTPRGTREASVGEGVSHPPRHSVASPFAGTKYLQDSDSDDDEKAVASRSSSIDNAVLEPTVSPEKPTLEVKRVDKPKQQYGGGVSWRAFSEGRAEQRTTEIETLQASLKQRGKSISFGSHALTDDGNRVPVQPSPDQIFAGARGRGKTRGKSPPRRAEDAKPSEDEMADGSGLGIYDPTQFKTNPFTGEPVRRKSNELDRNENNGRNGGRSSPSTSSVPNIRTDESGLESSTGSLTSKTTVSPPQTIPEGKPMNYSLSPVMSPVDMMSPLSRDSSTRSLRSSRSRPTRIPNSGRTSRRSTSANPSESPAHAFLSSWSGRDGVAVESAAEPKPDDEGQAIGLSNEYIIGRLVNSGGFGVVKEIHTFNSAGESLIRAVKIVRKSIPGKNEMENDRAQQELEHEVSIWRHLKHRHILELHAVYDTDFATFCVMDLNIGGTLFDVVRRSRGSASNNDGRKGLDPRMAKSYAYQLACALRYLHEDIRVCHRDVKLENCLIDMSTPTAESEGGILRLCDFGLSDFLHSEQTMDYLVMEGFGSPGSSSSIGKPTTSSIIGTLEYASPKGLSVHRKLFETAGDVWAFGVIAYVLCTGELPFKHAMPSKTVELILQAEWDDSALLYAAAGGSEVRELVQGCLEKDIDLRLTIGDTLRSAWFEDCREAAEEEPSGIWNE